MAARTRRQSAQKSADLHSPETAIANDEPHSVEVTSASKRRRLGGDEVVDKRKSHRAPFFIKHLKRER